MVGSASGVGEPGVGSNPSPPLPLWGAGATLADIGAQRPRS
jgi:hypothetical protein